MRNNRAPFLAPCRQNPRAFDTVAPRGLLARLKGIFPAVLLGAVLTACSPDQDPATSLSRAQAALANEDFTVALIETKNVLQAEPDNAEARLILGRLYLEVPNAQAALMEFQRAENNGLEPSKITLHRAKAFLITQDLDRLIALQMPSQDEDDPNFSEADRAEVIALQGYAQLLRRNSEAARRTFREALTLDPSNERALLGEVRLALAEQDLEQAHALAENLSLVYPDLPTAHEVRGDVARLKQDREGALDAYRRANELAPENIEILSKLIIITLLEKDLDTGTALIEELETLAPESVEALFSRGFLLYQQQAFSDAVVPLERVVAARPQDLRSKLLLGGAHLALGNFEQSLEMTETYLAMRPGAVKAALLASQALVAEGEYERAAETLRIARTYNPGAPSLIALQSQVALLNNSADQAVEFLRQIGEIMPELPGLNLSLGLALLQAGRPDDALKTLEAALTEAPDNVQANITYVRALKAADRLDEALSFATAFLKKAPTDAARVTLVGTLLSELGRADEARGLYLETLKAVPGDPDVSHNLAVMAMRDNKPRQAVALYEFVLKADTQHVPTLLRLGTVEYELGDTDAAEQHLRKALAIDPSQSKARVLLSRLISEGDTPMLAERLLDDTPRLLRNDPDILAERARLSHIQNRPLGALENLVRLVRETPEDGKAWLQLARIYEQQDNQREAGDAFIQAARYRPDDALFGSIVARGLQRTGHPQRAETLAAELEATYPGNDDLTLLRGWLLEQKGAAQDALTLYATLLEEKDAFGALIAQTRLESELGQTDLAVQRTREWEARQQNLAVLSIARAQYYLDANRREEALAELEALIQSRPQDPGLYNDAAGLLMDNNSPRALDYAKRAYELAPEEPAFLDTYGVALGKTGDWESAIPLLRTASELAPESLEIRLNLARGLLESGAIERGLTELDKVRARTNPGPLRDAADELQALYGESP